jgi:hypothetical protein
VMDIPAALITGFPPSPDRLLDVARKPIDDMMLNEIAKADFGDPDGLVLAQLRAIRDTGIIPARIDQVQTQLSMTTHCYEERPDILRLRAGRCGHQIALFSYAVLLRAAAVPHCEGELGSRSQDALGQCLEHAMALGNEAIAAAARFLTWRSSSVIQMGPSGPFGWDEWPLLSALGLLILAAHQRSGWITESVLGNTAEWVLAEEQLLAQQARAEHYWWYPKQGVLVSEQLAAELTLARRTIRNEDVRTSLDLCAILLERDKLGYVD